jgi:uncharacterized membrane protein
MNINIPDNVTFIGDYAFNGCTSLPIIDNIRYADTVLITVVDHTADNYTIKDGTKFILKNAFNSYQNLTEITIPNSVNYIQELAFGANLTYFYGNHTSADNKCCIINGVLIRLAHNGLSEYTLPSYITKLGDSSISNAKELKVLTIPDSVVHIGGNAFYYSGIENLIIPDSVKTMDVHALRGLTNCKTIYIGKNVSFSGSVHGSMLGMLEGSLNIESIVVSSENTTYDSRNNCNAIIKGNTLIAGCKTTVIPEGVTTIDTRAFQYTTCPTIFDLSAIQVIEYAAFVGSKVDTIILSDNLKTIDDHVFTNSQLRSINIPNSITSLPRDSFHTSKLESIDIPNSITSIGASCFYNTPLRTA